MMKAITRITTVALPCLLFAGQAAAAGETIITLVPEFRTMAIRDIAAGRLWHVQEVSPQALTVEGYGLHCRVAIVSQLREHGLALNVGRSNTLYYRSPAATYFLPKDDYSDYRLTYRFHRIIPISVLPGFALGLGPEFQWSRTQTRRYFAARNPVRYEERILSSALVLFIRYRPSRKIQLSGGIINGGLFGYEHTKPKKENHHFLNGWITDGYGSISYSGFYPFLIALRVHRRETVIIGAVYQQTVAENHWGLSLSYPWK